MDPAELAAAFAHVSHDFATDDAHDSADGVSEEGAPHAGRVPEYCEALGSTDPDEQLRAASMLRRLLTGALPCVPVCEMRDARAHRRTPCVDLAARLTRVPLQSGLRDGANGAWLMHAAHT